MTAHDRMLDPPDDDDEFIELEEPEGDYGPAAEEEGDWGSDERDIMLEKRYDH